MMVRNRLEGNLARDPAERDHAHQLGTNAERLKVAEWLLLCADGQSPKERWEVSIKFKQILRARHKANRKRKYGKGSLLLNQAEKEAVNKPMDEPLSHVFFGKYYAWCRAHGIEVSEGADRAQDVMRAAKMTEATVDRHFFGEFGLAAEMIDMGIMDPETKVKAKHLHVCMLYVSLFIYAFLIRIVGDQRPAPRE